MSGLVVVASTPFDREGRMRLEAIATYAATLKADNVAAAVIGSFPGEHLTASEKAQLANAWGAATSMIKVMFCLDDISAGDAADILGKLPPGISCVIVKITGASTSAVGAANVLCRVNRQTSLPIAVWLDADSDVTVGGLANLATAVGDRCPSLKAVISSKLEDLTCKVPMTLERVPFGEGLFGSAALSGCSAFCGTLASAAGPLLSRLVAAASKCDQAQVKLLLPFVAELTCMIRSAAANGTWPSLRSVCVAEAAAVKVLTALRLDQEVGGVRPPAGDLSHLDVQRLRDGMERFVKAYSTAVAPSAATAPSSGGINVQAMPGFLGKLDAKILSRIDLCAAAIGASSQSLRRKFPHLDKGGAATWRRDLPAKGAIDAARYIDHTILKPEATAKEVTQLCTEAKKHNFCAVCVNGSRVDQCLSELRGSGVRVAAVIGFPLGAGTAKAKAREAKELVVKGANEIDMVMNVGAFKDGDLSAVYEDIKMVVEASSPGIVKVIFESCLLSLDEVIDASILSVAAGAHFVKTSTGFNKGGATPEAIDAMLAVVGNEAEVKASGGVRDAPAALAYISAGVTRIGTSSGVAIVSGKAQTTGY